MDYLQLICVLIGSFFRFFCLFPRPFATGVVTVPHFEPVTVAPSYFLPTVPLVELMRVPGTVRVITFGRSVILTFLSLRSPLDWRG